MKIELLLEDAAVAMVMKSSAAAAGYGTVAVLPQAHPWRDRAEAMQLTRRAGDEAEAQILPWGSFSSGGA